MSERSEPGGPASSEPASERGQEPSLATATRKRVPARSAPAPKAPRAGKMSERSVERSGPSTQLRLLQSERPRPLRARKSPSRARRAVHWEGQWRLDSRTRRVGREGVAAARAALARTHPDELREAS